MCNTMDERGGTVPREASWKQKDKCLVRLLTQHVQNGKMHRSRESSVGFQGLWGGENEELLFSRHRIEWQLYKMNSFIVLPSIRVPFTVLCTYKFVEISCVR